MEDDVKEYVVLTPKSKTTNSTVLVVERCAKKEDNGKNNVHVAGGEHHGIIVNKTISHDNQDCVPADIVLEFRVYLVNAQTGAHTQESRSLKFWFKSNVLLNEQSTVAQQLFQDLVSPTEFPRDYIGFIKKIMKLMQNQYTNVKKIEIELKQLEEIAKIPKRPLSVDESILGTKNAELSEKKLLEIIESFYPNPVTVPELSLRYNWEEEKIKNYLNDLQNKGLVKPLDHGAFTRKVQNDVEVQIVKQMPNIVGAKQPTIAIITAQYCEKVAVDSLIENKETYVRYTTVGESNVYTLGNIGVHRVVCTKLPTVGHTREAMIAAGNTTTRLLGTFQKVDFVLLVGVGGGVPHYTDYKKHVRLGDVVISHAVEGKKYIYTYCENAKYDPETGTYEFETKDYHPTDLLLQEIAMKLKSQAESNPEKAPWLAYIEEGIQSLKKESSQDFCRPSIDSDKLYMCIGEKAIIEVAHPIPSDGENKFERIPRIHTAPIAAGRVVSRDEQLRQAFALHSCALAFDSEFDSVIESVIGSCRESFAIVRGIADYRDGTKRSEWQPFASISAAAVVKSIISMMKEIS